MIEFFTDVIERGHEACGADLLGEGTGRELDSMAGADYASRVHGALTDGHVQGMNHELGVLDRVNGPTNNSLAAGINHAATEHFAFLCRMLRDVADAGPIESRSGEATLDLVIIGGNPLDPYRFRWARKPTSTCVMSAPTRQPIVETNAASLHDLGTRPPRPVGASRLLFHLQ